ncbi:succinyl-CoA synthetase subunit beta [Vibrio mediterranei]|uniref:Protein acetyltransferase n=1 Tax=Vibrio mediterranei TaxID=689 RepID=A0ABX5D698_9VIBR|nr:bifunctional acetate--CoA ligase family protein/GNAT family N-acetyltransferase [Vibrio mediterranei]MCG9662619.1 bifunctional acetate--CoA ligase family protein/GNAT family N-acetyltransferase [Vibrio mediterranei]PCD86070.1 protein acetyltransferase [Vibrio mediterranei]PRQ65189.1 protein acetyltransferase [Vibrio mediterranei]SBO08167.1 succinyl-CoA synthetase subunit beta [Vibrio mediterranei]
MSLDTLFKPSSIAVIGASIKPHRAGSVVIKNLLLGGYQGTILPVHPRYKSVNGILCYRAVSELPLKPDVAILCTKGERNVDLFNDLAISGVKTVIVMASDMSRPFDDTATIEQKCLQIAQQSGMRILGPNSLGILLPWQNFNASFSPVNCKRGKLAFISQSSAVCTTILDWANDKNIGFSAFLSIGSGLDVDFDELLDYLARDSKTESILLYVDSIRDARRFMSAARAASRNRRILVLKAGRNNLTNLVKGHESDSFDIVYDSAIQRAGMLRVNNTHELFAAVETLTHSVPLRGERLAVITNGIGPANMALDTLTDRGGSIAQLSDDTISKLSNVLPDTWSKGNPIDLVGDATAKRYCDALSIVLDSDDVDAILIMHSPSATADSQQTATDLIETIKKHPKSKRFNILTNWSGEATAKDARLLFTNHGIPTYRTPESAVTAFMHLVEYRRNQWQLMETPTTTDSYTTEQLSKAHEWLASHVESISEDKEFTQLESHICEQLFDLFELPTLPTWLAHDPTEAIHLAENIGYPVTVKLRSPDIAHKSDIHGVMLNLRDANEVSSAAQSILDRTKLSYPEARIEGLTVQQMAKIAGGQEIRVKVITDATFGPAIFLGQGGSDWKIEKEAVTALPPVNMALARYLIINAINKGTLRFQQSPNPVNLGNLAQFLVKISQIIVACPEIHELDIHPLLLNGNDITILDASVVIKGYEGEPQARLAIRPYPTEMEELITLKDGSKISLRPIRPEDEPFHADFINNVTKEDLYKRFFSDVGEFNHEALANLTQIDYDREMAFVAVDLSYANPHIIGVSRVLVTPDNSDAEFAILIRSDLKGKGLGRVLMNKIIDYCKSKNTRQISGMTMPTNRGMLTLAQKLGFELDVQFEDGVADMVLMLNR